MSHELAKKANGEAAMAYVGEKPWHNLGQELQAGASIDVWKKAAGMDFTIGKAPVMFNDRVFEGQVVLHREDTGTPLAVVSKTYKVVQPEEILEFYRNLTEKLGFTLETAGVLFGGKKYWALASIGKEASIQNVDPIKGYLLLATASDGTMATVAKYESIRVVCNNTLQMAMRNMAGAVKTSHRSEFSPGMVQSMLGIADDAWDGFIGDVNVLANVHLAEEEAKRLIAKLYGADASNDEQVTHVLEHVRAAGDILELYQGGGMGSSLATADGTAWGLMNATTEYYDWQRAAKTTDGRIDKAWFGDGANFKGKMWNNLVSLTK